MFFQKTFARIKDLERRVSALESSLDLKSREIEKLQKECKRLEWMMENPSKYKVGEVVADKTVTSKRIKMKTSLPEYFPVWSGIFGLLFSFLTIPSFLKMKGADEKFNNYWLYSGHYTESKKPFTDFTEEQLLLIERKPEDYK